MEYREPLHERRAEVWAREHLAVLDAAERGDLLDICTSLRQHLLNALGHGLSARLAAAEVGAGEAVPRGAALGGPDVSEGRLRGVVAAIPTPIDERFEPDRGRFLALAPASWPTAATGSTCSARRGRRRRSPPAAPRPDGGGRALPPPARIADGGDRGRGHGGRRRPDGRRRRARLRGRSRPAAVLLQGRPGRGGRPLRRAPRRGDEGPADPDLPLQLPRPVRRALHPSARAAARGGVRRPHPRREGFLRRHGLRPGLGRSPARPRRVPSTEACLLDARDGVFAGCISATANIDAPYCARAFRDGDASALRTAVALRGLFEGKPLVPGVKALLAALADDPALSAVLPPLVPWPPDARRALLADYTALTASP